MMPIAGSTYSYAFVAFGLFPAWFIGWDLLLEYLFAASTVAVGWSGYADSLLASVGIHVRGHRPDRTRHAPCSWSAGCTALLVRGTRSRRGPTR